MNEDNLSRNYVSASIDELIEKIMEKYDYTEYEACDVLDNALSYEVIDDVLFDYIDNLDE